LSIKSVHRWRLDCQLYTPCLLSWCIHSDVPDLRAQISLANNIGENEKADWLDEVLDLNNKTVAVDNQGPYSPQDYLNKGKILESTKLSSGMNAYM
jgi:hypothetical protein